MKQRANLVILLMRRSLWGLMLSCVLLACVGDTWADDFWWNPAWNHRVPMSVSVGTHARVDKPAEVAVNFTELLTASGESGALDLNSLRVVEIDVSGQLVNPADPEVPFQFDPDPAFDAAANAVGTLIVLVEGTTVPNTTRFFHIYFDVVGGGFSPAVVPDQVLVADDVPDEGQNAIQVATQAGTYFYQKQGAGFSSFVDSDGNDWIDYHPSGGAAGDYRGIPNLVYPEGHFHPGATSAITTLVSDGPLKATIHSITTDGLWEGQWEIYPQYAKLTVLKAANNYWFLYEGTPGGVLDPASDFLVRADGTQTPLSDSWTQDLAGDEWVYFADPFVGAGGRSLFVANHTKDTAVDSYFPLGGQMTVFGFGRNGLSRSLNQVPGEFTIGLMDETVFASASTTVLAAYKDLSVVLENAPPSIASVGAFGDPTQVTITFSKAVDPVTAEDVSNYAISDGITVLAASLSPDGRTVTLTTSALSDGITYTLTVNGVEDLFGNVIAFNSQISFDTQTQASTDGPFIDVWYGFDQSFGHIGTAQPWVNILGNVSDPDGLASLGYSLNGGPELPLSIGPDTRRLFHPGDFNVEMSDLDLIQGLNSVIITATDSLGNETAEIVNFDYNSTNVWPKNYSIDWSAVTEIQDVAQIVDGLWVLDTDGVGPVELGYDRLIAIGDLLWDDYEITVPITIHGIDPNPATFQPPSVHAWVGVVMRWQGHQDWGGSQPVIGWHPMGAAAGYNFPDPTSPGYLFMKGWHSFSVQDTNLQPEFGVRHYLKVRVETTAPDEGGLYSAKVWRDGDPEPTEWQLVRQDDPDDLKDGSLLLVSHHVDVTFGDISIQPAGPTPKNVSVITGVTEATITWETSKPATSSVAYGLNAAYEGGVVEDSTC